MKNLGLIARAVIDPLRQSDKISSTGKNSSHYIQVVRDSSDVLVWKRFTAVRSVHCTIDCLGGGVIGWLVE